MIDLAFVQDYVTNENKSYNSEFVEIPFKKNNHARTPFKLMRNRDFLCQLYREAQGVIRISICRTEVTALSEDGPIWGENITWDELQFIKLGLGYGHRDAVEIFPKQEDVVNVANLRHLWILPEHSLHFIWRKRVK